MLIFDRVLGKMIYMAPEEGEDGDAAGGPADTDAGSHDESEFESLAEEMETDSYEEDFEEDTGESDDDAASDDAAAQEEDPAASEEEDESDDDLNVDEEDGKDEEDAGEEDESDEDEEPEEKPEPMTPEQITEARNQYIDQMAEQFSITEDEADMLRTEPEKVMPKMMARAMTTALEHAVGIMKNNLPQLVGNQLTQQTQAQQIEQKFFGNFPELKSKKAVKIAEGIAKGYRQANPDASTDEIMENVALMTWRRMGLPMDQLAERLEAGLSEEFTPAAKQQRKQSSAFTPANPGRKGADPAPRRREEKNEFEELANLMQNDSMFDD